MKSEPGRLRQVGFVIVFASLACLLPVHDTAAQRSRSSLDPVSVASARRSQLRRMMAQGQTPSLASMQGQWRGVNKGMGPKLMGFSQFTKQFGTQGSAARGDNIVVHQVPKRRLATDGWRPVVDPRTGRVERRGSFAIKPPTGHGRMGHARELNYREGNNPRGDASRLLVDKIVMLDANHMLGRATIKLGPIRIPVAYFALERIQ